jgi:hypothetical protein
VIAPRSPRCWLPGTPLVYDNEHDCYTAMSNADRYVHLLTEYGSAFCGYSVEQLRPARDLHEVANSAGTCRVCAARWLGVPDPERGEL